MRISDWSSDVCSSDLPTLDALWPGMRALHGREQQPGGRRGQQFPALQLRKRPDDGDRRRAVGWIGQIFVKRPLPHRTGQVRPCREEIPAKRSEEHTSELQSLMRISYAVFCLKKKNTYT